MDEHGHASPRETPFTCVLDAGQMPARLSTRTFHRVGIMMIGTDEACVDGWDSR